MKATTSRIVVRFVVGPVAAAGMPANWTDTLRNYRDKWADSQKHLQVSIAAAN
jgi:hypothetical protein